MLVEVMELRVLFEKIIKQVTRQYEVDEEHYVLSRHNLFPLRLILPILLYLLLLLIQLIPRLLFYRDDNLVLYNKDGTKIAT